MLPQRDEVNHIGVAWSSLHRCGGVLHHARQTPVQAKRMAPPSSEINWHFGGDAGKGEAQTRKVQRFAPLAHLYRQQVVLGAVELAFLWTHSARRCRRVMYASTNSKQNGGGRWYKDISRQQGYGVGHKDAVRKERSRTLHRYRRVIPRHGNAYCPAACLDPAPSYTTAVVAVPLNSPPIRGTSPACGGAPADHVAEHRSHRLKVGPHGPHGAEQRAGSESSQVPETAARGRWGSTKRFTSRGMARTPNAKVALLGSTFGGGACEIRAKEVRSARVLRAGTRCRRGRWPERCEQQAFGCDGRVGDKGERTSNVGGNVPEMFEGVDG